MTKILIVDDDLESVKLIGLMLERRGYDIIAAQAGTQGLAKAQTEDPDLIILDLMMPDMDGYEVCRRLRANEETADLPIIMFTAKTQLDDKVAGFQAGADDYLTKPVHPDELAARVEAVLLRASQRKGEAGEGGKGGKVVGFIGAKGGVGTTTLAANIAVSMQQMKEDEQVILAELSGGLGTVAIQLGLRHQVGLHTLLDQMMGRIDQRLVEAQLEEHTTGLLVLSGETQPPGVAIPLFPDQAEAIIDHLRELSDYLLLDLGVGLTDTNQQALLMCDSVVVVVEPQREAMQLALALLHGMDETVKIPAHRMDIVLVKKAASASTYTQSKIEEELGFDLVGVITPAPELAFQSAERGIPMAMMQSNNLASQQYKRIAERLLK